MTERRILGVHITDRKQEAGAVQKVLTQYGCSIKTRLGLHEVTQDHCSTEGLIILELIGDVDEMGKLEESLEKVPGTQTKKMVFNG